MALTDWGSLDAELDAWAASGRQPRFWWRDDDAEAPSDALDSLLSLRRDAAVPLALAVIPATARTTLRGVFASDPDISILQHGYDHANHAPRGAKKAELAAGRSRVKVVAQLTEGAARLRSLFGDAFAAVVVPPWNRIDPALVPVLPRAGYRGLSAFAGRHAPGSAAGLGRADCHIDIVDWHGGRGFVGLEGALSQAITALAAARTGATAPAAIGLLTHHRAMDAACWEFTREFLRRTGTADRAHWIGIADALFFER